MARLKVHRMFNHQTEAVPAIETLPIEMNSLSNDQDLYPYLEE